MRIFSCILCYIRFADQESLVEHGAGSTLYWSGKKKEERRLFGVGLMIKNTIANKLHILPVGHSDRLMSLRLPLKTVCMPQLFKEMPTQKKLSTEISFPLLKVDKRDKILIIGDFNARVGGDHEIWKESSEHMAKESVMIK